MRLPENDAASLLATELTSDEGAGGGGLPLDLSQQLTSDTNQTPPVYAPAPPATDDAPAASTPVLQTAGAPAPVPVSVSPGFFAKMTSALASAQGSLPMGGLRTMPLQAAAKLGADNQTATTIAVWLWPVVVVLAGISVTVYMLRRRIFSHHVTA